jgi:hypothetical protein
MEMAVSMVEARRRKQAAAGGSGGGSGSIAFSAEQLATTKAA